MKPTIATAILIAVTGTSSFPATAQESRIEVKLDTTHIHANHELPQLLYIIPWRDTTLINGDEEPRIVIPDLFADFYEPIVPTLEKR